MAEMDNNNEDNVVMDDKNNLLKTTEQDTNHPFIGIDVPLIGKENNKTDNDINSNDDDNNLTNDVIHEEKISLNESSNEKTSEVVLPSEAKVIKVTHFICNIIDDHKYQYLQEKTQSAWCKPNARFHGVQCKGCTKIFVHEKGDSEKTFKPSVRKALWCCPNEKQKCTYAICADCRLKESKKSSELSKNNKDEEINENMEVTMKE